MENNELDIDLEELKRRNANPTGAKYVPVHCPRCKSRNVKFLPEYRKCIGLRFFTGLFFVLAAVSYLLDVIDLLQSSTKKETSSDVGLVFAIIFGVVAFTFYAIRLWRESKTHVQCVCPDCGKVWIHQW